MSEDRGERLQIMLSEEELTLLDNFRFQSRMPSRAAAVRELLKRGLHAEGFSEAAFGAKSSEYGVTGEEPKGRDGHAEADGRDSQRPSGSSQIISGAPAQPDKS